MKNPFRRITPQDVARRELEQSKLMALQYESQALYNHAMAEYHQVNIQRLEHFLGYDKNPKAPASEINTKTAQEIYNNLEERITFPVHEA